MGRKLSDREHYPNLIDLTGRRFGSRVVLSFAGRKRYLNATSHALWRVRCDCGRVDKVLGYHLRYRYGWQCVACGKKASAAANKARSTPVGHGETLVSVAAKSGVSLNTVTQRWIRGWPPEDLGLPVKGPRGKRTRPVARFRNRRAA